MSNQLDTMLALLATSEPAVPKSASAPAVAPAPAPAIAPAAVAPTPARIEAAALKIAGAEDESIRASASAFGTEFARSAAEYFEKNNVFPKVASAPGATIDVENAYRAGYEKGASESVARFREGYASQLKIAHDIAIAAHFSGQQHSAALRKSAGQVDANGVAKSASDALGAVLPFVKTPEPAAA